ncbi:MAG: hypothetical protein WAV22_06975, partial [Porticoccaceae bacterium]
MRGKLWVAKARKDALKSGPIGKSWPWRDAGTAMEGTAMKRHSTQVVISRALALAGVLLLAS